MTMHFHWQNLREDARGNPRGFSWHGRAWLGDLRERVRLRVEWVFGSSTCGAKLAFLNQGDTVSGHAALPPVALYWGVELPFRGAVHRFLDSLVNPTDMSDKYGAREFSLQVHDWAIWWSVWTDPNGWSSKRPRWRNGAFHVLDALLGKAKHSSVELKRVSVVVPMPEGVYGGECALTEDTWQRPRWFAKRLRRATVEMREPIPFPGKGENDWDCGEDALYGLTAPASTVAEAVAATAASALRSRERYGGIDYVPEKLRSVG